MGTTRKVLTKEELIQKQAKLAQMAGQAVRVASEIEVMEVSATKNPDIVNVRVRSGFIDTYIAGKVSNGRCYDIFKDFGEKSFTWIDRTHKIQVIDAISDFIEKKSN